MSSLRFDRKLLLAFGLLIAVALLAVVVAVLSLRGSAAAFGTLLHREVAHESAAADLYAQGLQQEVALRNIVLDPGLERAYKNLAQAQIDYQSALEIALSTATTPEQRKLLETIVAVGPKRDEVAVKIVALAKSDSAAATSLLNSVGTPAWRELRGNLIELRKLADAGSQAVANGAVAAADRAIVIASGLAGLALVFAVIMVAWLRRTILRELGGDPAEVRDVLQQVAQGNLQQKIVVARGAEASLVAAIAEMQRGLNQTLLSVRSSVEAIATASGQIAVGNQDLSSRTESQAANLQETAASMDELTSTVASSADAARQANQLAASASEVAARGGEVVGQVVTTMDEISAASRKIGEIIGVIDGIAFQTNILALNAAVEAARAGEQGRGFAVVAGEVRSLAQRSAQAAREIKSLIGDSAGKVAAGAQQVQEAGATMNEIVVQVQRVTDLMAEITAGTQEQSAGIEQVNQAVATLDQMTQQNAALVEESAAAAESLKQQANELDEAVARFRLAGAPSPSRPSAAVSSSVRAEPAWAEF